MTFALRFSAFFMAASFVLAVNLSVAQEPSRLAFRDRPLNLPVVDAGESCPASAGSASIVSSQHGYIFGAGGHFFGSGPLYFALSWKPASRAEARFELVDNMPSGAEGYRLKTPWIIEPGFRGQALVRGARIDSTTNSHLLFGNQSSMTLRPADQITLDGWRERWGVDAAWSFWPTSMVVPGPGCYALQVDTESKSDIVVFEVEP